MSFTNLIPVIVGVALGILLTLISPNLKNRFYFDREKLENRITLEMSPPQKIEDFRKNMIRSVIKGIQRSNPKLIDLQNLEKLVEKYYEREKEYLSQIQHSTQEIAKKSLSKPDLKYLNELSEEIFVLKQEEVSLYKLK